jgi:hypothetical protein
MDWPGIGAGRPAVTTVTVVSRRSYRPLLGCALAGLAIVALVGGLGVARASPSPQQVPRPVVVIGLAGLTWDAVNETDTPTITRLLSTGAGGALAVHSLHGSACPVDGWLALSSGRLAAAPRATGDPDSCPPVRQPESGAAPQAWPDYLAAAEHDDRGAVLGALGQSVADSGLDAVGIGPGAAIALAGPDGRPAGQLEPLPPDLTDLTVAVRAAVQRAYLIVVDLAVVVDGTPGSARDADSRIAAVTRALPPDASVLVASLADRSAEPHLQVIVGSGPTGVGPWSTRGGLLASQSTRQPGLLQGTDLAPTVLSLLGQPPSPAFGGAALTIDPRSGSLADLLRELRDFDAAARAVQPYVVVFFLGLVLIQLAWYALAAYALRRGWARRPGGRRRAWLRTVQWVGVGFASVPAATFPANLVPWWRSAAPFLTLLALVLAGATVITVLAMLLPWRGSLLGPLGVVASLTAAILAADVLTGSHLMISSLMGLQPLVAGRFYGFGNVAFALFATAALLAATVIADSLLRRQRRAAALAVVVAIGAVAIVVDGAPGLGSDFGGPIAMVPAFTILALTVARIRMSWRAALAIAGLTVAVVAALAIIDYQRPAQDRTHLGAFVASVLDGEATQVIGRKLAQNVGILFGNPAGLLVPIVMVVLVLVVIRPSVLGLTSLLRAYDLAPALRPGLVALLVLLALGFAFNDSGAVVPAIAASMTVPLLVYAGARTAERDPAER